MSEIQWKVGDTGLTRDGRPYEVTAVDDHPSYPIDAKIDGTWTGSWARSGLNLEGHEDGCDLMPPSEPAPTRDERRERIACSVLAGLAADRHRSDVQGVAENAACIAVAWADALIAELAK